MHDNTQRADEFRAEVAAMKLRDPASGLDRLLVRLGVLGLVSGPCFAVAAWFISHGTRNPLQQRDAIVAALLGLTLAVVGGALFVKGAVAGFLRFWMARLCYEQQAQADRISASLRYGNGRTPAPEIVRTRSARDAAGECTRRPTAATPRSSTPPTHWRRWSPSPSWPTRACSTSTATRWAA
jgi:hypothetical protein